MADIRPAQMPLPRIFSACISFSLCLLKIYLTFEGQVHEADQVSSLLVVSDDTNPPSVFCMLHIESDSVIKNTLRKSSHWNIKMFKGIPILLPFYRWRSQSFRETKALIVSFTATKQWSVPTAHTLHAQRYSLTKYLKLVRQSCNYAKWRLVI